MTATIRSVIKCKLMALNGKAELNCAVAVVRKGLTAYDLREYVALDRVKWWSKISVASPNRWCII